MNHKLRGGCLCGATRYELTAAPIDVNDCHCEDCRKAAGAPFVTWGSVERDEVRLLQGALRRVPHASRVRSFANCCGTPLFFEESSTAPTIELTIASLDEPHSFAPTMSIWLEDRLPWVVLDPARPQFQQSSRST